MTEHQKKKIAPIVVTIIMIVYYFVYFGVMVTTLPPVLNVLLGVIPLIFGAVTIYVCIQRLKEIDGGEEDDLSQY